MSAAAKKDARNRLWNTLSLEPVAKETGGGSKIRAPEETEGPQVNELEKGEEGAEQGTSKRPAHTRKVMGDQVWIKAVNILEAKGQNRRGKAAPITLGENKEGMEEVFTEGSKKEVGGPIPPPPKHR